MITDDLIDPTEPVLKIVKMLALHIIVEIEHKTKMKPVMMESLMGPLKVKTTVPLCVQPLTHLDQTVEMELLMLEKTV
ncbi:hypothetical protein IJU97_05475 [bacterium]|nr:hypothetical protein [bacterium]